MTQKQIDIEHALHSTAWPFQEAKRLKERFEKNPPKKGYILFETGYGPSGLPHIGTFGEVFRTTMVRQAFMRISDIPTRLYAFSDDMDGLRKVPDNVPNREMLKPYCTPSVADEEKKLIGGVPLTSIPDPWGKYESFAHHNNHRLRQFLDEFGFDYEFKSATECYKQGDFDEYLRKTLEKHEKIIDIVRKEYSDSARLEHYSPFLPIVDDNGTPRTLHVKIDRVDVKNGTVIFKNPLKNNEETELPVTGGHCKLQWRADWGMRWAAFDVDYEMHGKDLTPSAALSSRICSVIGGTPPVTYVYEMFLDEKGEKISKSKGNGISLEQWLKYGTPQSLALYMFNNPRKAKRLYFDVIPQHVDEYLKHLENLDPEDHVKLLQNPVWHIHNGEAPAQEVPLSFGLLLNLASACNAGEPETLWGFITRYSPDATPEKNTILNELVRYAVAYYDDFVKPNKEYREPNADERKALEALKKALEKINHSPPAGESENAKPFSGGGSKSGEKSPPTESACASSTPLQGGSESAPDALQQLVLDVAKENGYGPETMREWYKLLYETLFGQSTGPRMGSFIALYGVDETIQLIDQALERKLKAA